MWFRGKDLRVADHEPLALAARAGEVACLFVLDPYFFAPERARRIPHRVQFLLESIAELRESLRALGGELVLARGKSIDVVPELARAWRVDRVVAQRWAVPIGRKRDAIVAARLGVPFELTDGETLRAPGTLRTRDGRPFSLFTPFARAHRASTIVGAPLPVPRELRPARVSAPRVKLPALEELGIARNPRLLAGGETAARARLRRFLRKDAALYDRQRDRLDLDATSHLSADLKFGTTSPRAVWTAARRALEKKHPAAWESFSNELLWRELAHDLVFHDPSLLERPRRAEFERLPWRDDRAGWKAWCEGRTGYPIVDAAARQLLEEGFVHNRARMIAASFLVKDLLVDYRRGEAHYLKWLTDGDWAQNNLGWQWSAGCGADAQPWFRIFNPVAQAQRFDPTGAYVRRWVPELAALSDDDVHAPWEASREALRAAGIVLGKTYPRPILDHEEARERFLRVGRKILKREE